MMKGQMTENNQLPYQRAALEALEDAWAQLEADKNLFAIDINARHALYTDPEPPPPPRCGADGSPVYLVL